MCSYPMALPGSLSAMYFTAKYAIYARISCVDSSQIGSNHGHFLVRSYSHPQLPKTLAAHPLNRSEPPKGMPSWQMQNFR